MLRFFGFFPLVWPEHLEPGNFRVQKYSQDVADGITTHNISLSKREQITMWGTSSHNQLLKIKEQRAVGGRWRQEVRRAEDGSSAMDEQVVVTLLAMGAGRGHHRATQAPGTMAEHEWHLQGGERSVPLFFQNKGIFSPLQLHR